MKLMIFLLSFSTLGTVAAACETQWFVRNMIFNQAGYCFGSNLGQAVFDNSDCTTREPTLSSQDQQIVNQIREDEEWIGCRIDTSSTRLNLPNLQAWLRLEQVALPDTLASGCMGWLGKTVELRAGPRANAPINGTLRPGDNIIFEFYGIPGWSFYQSNDGVGWTQSSFPQELCTSVAG